MPKKGYKSITVKESLLQKLSEIAESLSRSIPDTLEIIVNQYKGGETG